MVGSCRLSPVVHRRVGTKIEEKDSRLYKEIKQAVQDRDTAWEMWAFTKTSEFKNKYGKAVEYDELGEVTFPSLIKALGLKDSYDTQKSAEEAARDYGFAGTVFQNPEEAITGVNAFNAKEKKFIAVMQKTEGGHTVNVLPRLASSMETARQQSYNHALTGEIIDLLRSIGFDVSFVSNPRYEGLFDPENAKLHDGLLQIISIAKGEIGEQALPEEFSHLIIEGLIAHPLVKRLLASLTDEQIQEILGTGFDEYSLLYDGDPLKMKKEAAGKMLAQYITGQGTISKPVMEPKKSLLSRIWNWAKGLFSKIKGQQLNNARLRAWDSIADIYNLVASGEAVPIIDKRSILSSAQLYKIKEKYNSLEKIAQIGEGIMARMYLREKTRSKDLKAISSSRENLQKIQELNSYEGDKAFESVDLFLKDAERQAKRIMAEMRKASKNEASGKMDNIHIINEAAKVVRQIDTFVLGYQDIIKTIATFDELDNIEKLGLSNEDLGKMLANGANTCLKILNSLSEWRQATAKNIVYNSARTVYKEDKVRDIGSKRNEIMSLEQILDHASRDINYVDRWLSAMSDADDAYLTLFDSIVKNQQYERDMEMIEWKAQIAAADEKLREAGYTSDFTYELGEDGIPTGRILSQYDWDGYNKELKEYRTKIREQQEREGKDERWYRDMINQWKDGRLIKVYVDPKIDADYREKGKSAVPDDAIFEMVPNPKVFTKNANKIDNLAPAQRDYYNEMMRIKREMMTKIPHRGQGIYKAVYISKDFVEGLLDAENPLKATYENYKKKFLRRPDDIGFGTHDDFGKIIEEIIKKEEDSKNAADKILSELSSQLDEDITAVIRPKEIQKIIKEYHKALSNNTSEEKKEQLLKNTVDSVLETISNADFAIVETDFANHRIQRLPIYYTRPLKDMRMLSRDFSGSLIAYSAMAINYEKMNEVVDILEVGRNYAKERGVLEKEGNQSVISRFNALGKAYHSFVERAGSGSMISGRLDDYMASVVYEERKDDEGQVEILGANIDVAKTLDTIKDYTGLLGLGFNLFSTISNLAVGKLQQWIEAAGGEYFTFKDYAKAVTQYSTLMWGAQGSFYEIASPVKKNKLSLLIQMFDPMGDYYESLRDPNFNKSAVSRILGSGALAYIGMNAGEHTLHCQTMLAVLNSIKLTNAKTEEKISLYDALEVKEVNGIARLELKPDLYYERELIDNTGIKNPESRNFNKNYGRPMKDKDGKIMTEKVFLHSISDNETQKFIFKKKRIIRKVNDSLNGAFSANDKGAIHKKSWGRLIMQFRQWMPAHYMRRFARAHYDADLEQWREGYYITVWKTINQLRKDCKKAEFRLLKYGSTLSEHERANLRRATAEVAEFLTLLTLVRLGGRVKDRDRSWLDKMVLYQIHRMYLEVGASAPLNPGTFFSNIFTLLQSPSASINTFEKFSKVLNIFNMMDEIQTGRFQGWTEWERDAYMAVPAIGQITKAVDFDDSMFSMYEKD